METLGNCEAKLSTDDEEEQSCETGTEEREQFGSIPNVLRTEMDPNRNETWLMALTKFCF
jgi:hypothetical protein